RVEVVRGAVQRGPARPHPARVEADHVVLRGHLLGQRRGDEPGERPATAAGPARVDQQGPLVRRRGVRHAGQRERDRAPARIRVVQRHLDGRALEPRVVLGGALLPGGRRGGDGGGAGGRRGAGRGGQGRQAA